MKIIVELFIAPDDQAAATILEGGPGGMFESLTVGNFDAISAIEEWDRIQTAASRDDLATAALRWIEQEELRGYDPELFTDILGQLAALAGAARQEGHALYCRMC